MNRIRLLDSVSGDVDQTLESAIIRMAYSICSSMRHLSSMTCNVYIKEIEDEYDIQIPIGDHNYMNVPQFWKSIRRTSNGSMQPEYIDDRENSTMPYISSTHLVDETYTKIGVLCKSDADCWYVMTPGSIVPRVIHFEVIL